MDEMETGLSATEMADLAALADGSLPAERRAAVEARVAASSELQEALARQRRAVAATADLAAEPTPASLSTIGERPSRDRARRSRRLMPRLAGAGALAAGIAVAVVAVVALSGGPTAPTVADAARLAQSKPTAPPPTRLGHGRPDLALAVEGVEFPDLARAYGWRPVGVHRGELDGRRAAVVYYRKGSATIAYAIVAAPGLAQPSGAPVTVRRGTAFRAIRVNGRPAVTWRRAGHTCVLTGPISHRELLTLASWRGGGQLRY
jgi:anti-sigma factor RsiW